ncbi:hypothetical protein V6N13_055480 [Hibiscus sabdariffa]
MMLEDLNWSYFKEIFRDVKLLVGVSKMVKRATWIEIAGVSLHNWNGTTCKRLVEVCGEFEAFGENLDFCLDCEKTKVLITTNLPQKINVVVDLEVGNMVYEVRINEVGFSDIVGRQHELSKTKVDNGSKQNNTESMMSSSSESSRSKVHAGDEVGRSQENDKALNVACFGNHYLIWFLMMCLSLEYPKLLVVRRACS